jgi:hypothetical protein
MDPITLAAATGALEVVSSVGSRLRATYSDAKHTASYFKNGSLIDIAQVARVEPIVMVDADCMNLDYLPDVMQTMHTLFSGYYLQAVNLLGTIGSVSVASRLGPLNPNRGLGFESYADWRSVEASYAHRLPTTKNHQAVAMEEARASTDKDAMTTIRDATNLAVGKLFNVTLKEGDQSAVIPVSIRLMVATLPTNAMVGLFTFKDSFDMDLKERYHSWKAGRLSFMKDLIMCQDLIDKHRKALVTDKSNVYAQILARENSNRKVGLMRQNPSLATASNLAVLSSDTLGQIELKLNGKFSNFKVRQAVFNNTNLMLMCVVDKSWERVTIYSRGIEGSTQVSAKDMKAGSKNTGGSEVMDIMKAYMSGSAVSI